MRRVSDGDVRGHRRRGQRVSARGRAPTASAGAAGRARPNILFVLTDDMAKSELSVMPHVRAAARRAGDDVLAGVRQRVAVLPVAHDDPARPVLAQHRRRDERRRERRLRDRVHEGRRELDDRDVAARRGLPHRTVRQVPQRLPERRRRHVRPAGLGRVREPDPRRQPVPRVRLQPQRERAHRALRLRARATTAPTSTATWRRTSSPAPARERQAVLRVPRAVRAAPSRDARRRGDVDQFPDAKAPRTPSYNEADVSDKPALAARHTAHDSGDRGARRHAVPAADPVAAGGRRLGRRT